MLDPKINNRINQWALHLASLGHDKPFINRFVARMVKSRGPLANGCTCNNWGPRWIEDSLNGCCPACWAGALKADQMMKVNGVKPVSVAMIDQSQSWGFNKPMIYRLRVDQLLAGRK
jgi:hypothetical protein